MIIVLLIIILAFCIWGITIGFVYILKALRSRKYDLVDIWRSLLEYLKRRADRIVFLKFLGIEAGCAGLLPQLHRFMLDINGWQICFELGYGADYVSAIVAVIVGVGYYLYLKQGSWTKPEHWDSVVDAAMLINNNYNFRPTQQWFVEQNNQAFVALDKRYNSIINFPYDKMDWLLASLEKDDGFWEILWNDLDEFVDRLNSYQQFIEKRKETNNEAFINTIKNCKASKEAIDNLSSDANTYIELREAVNKLLESMREVIDAPIRQDFSFRNLQDKSYEIREALSNRWIEFKSKKFWMMIGEAGIGKSHLMGDIVFKRLKREQPTILLLGEQFNTQQDPLEQMKSKLDVLCKKEIMLDQLNHYGEVNGKIVCILIDGINENDGEILWKRYLKVLISQISKYEWLKLVVSFRISDAKNWFYEFSKEVEWPVYEHKGFVGKEQMASEYLFGSFGLDQPLWPAYGYEFANPMFLIKYCRLHEKIGGPLELEDFWTTINKFCHSLNSDIALKYGYDANLELVTNAMNTIAGMIVNSGSRSNLVYDDAIDKLRTVARNTHEPEKYLSIMIDEGLLRTDRTSDNQVTVDFGFEMIGDYFIANYILKNGLDVEESLFKYGYGVPDALAVIVPQQRNKELFEIVGDRRKKYAFDLMVRTSGWRESFTPKGLDVIRQLKEKGYYDNLFDIISHRPFRSDNVANSQTLYELLWGLSMKERDELWTTKISGEGEWSDRYLELAQWATNASDNSLKTIKADHVFRCAEALVWALSSTWRILRDTATHGLVALLSVKTELILPLLEKYYEVNDDYIAERLWAAVMGAVLRSQEKVIATKVASWTYNQLFENGNVPEHILIRDYAKIVVTYAQSLGADLNIENAKLELPLGGKGIPEHIIDGDEITKRYGVSWDDIKSEDRAWKRAQNAILDSMKTEHSSRGMYGDFGRYVFESSLHEMKVDPEAMSNWAIEMIFEDFGYDAKTFANFDAYHENYDRSRNKIERIGKKYQWIAMYRILAVVQDTHPHIEFKYRAYTPLESVRNIDSTYRPKELLLGAGKEIYRVPQYNLDTPEDDKKWVKDWRHMPPIEEYLVAKDEQGHEWINLNSYNAVKRRRDLTDENSKEREIWSFVQAFAVKKEQLKAVCKEINKEGLQHRNFRENTEIDSVYSREFYWSDEFKECVKSEDYGWKNYETKNRVSHDVWIAPTYLVYARPSSEDASSEKRSSILMPNEWLFNGLGLKFGKEDGSWINDRGEVVMIDNAVYGNGHRALLVRKDVLLDYFNREGYALFWPVLSERQISGRHARGAYHEQNGGWVYMDEKGNVHQHFRCYELTPMQYRILKYKNKFRRWWIPKKHLTIMWLHSHRIIHLSDAKLWQIMGFDPRIPSIDIDEWPDKEYEEMLAKMEREGCIVDNDAIAEQNKKDWEKLMALAEKYGDEDDDLEEDSDKEEPSNGP